MKTMKNHFLLAMEICQRRIIFVAVILSLQNAIISCHASNECCTQTSPQLINSAANIQHQERQFPQQGILNYNRSPGLNIPVSNQNVDMVLNCGNDRISKGPDSRCTTPTILRQRILPLNSANRNGFIESPSGVSCQQCQQIANTCECNNGNSEPAWDKTSCVTSSTGPTNQQSTLNPGLLESAGASHCHNNFNIQSFAAGAVGTPNCDTTLVQQPSIKCQNCDQYGICQQGINQQIRYELPGRQSECCDSSTKVPEFKSCDYPAAFVPNTRGQSVRQQPKITWISPSFVEAPCLRSPTVVQDSVPNIEQLNSCDYPGTFVESTCGQSTPQFVRQQPDVSLVFPGASVEAPCCTPPNVNQDYAPNAQQRQSCAYPGTFLQGTWGQPMPVFVRQQPDISTGSPGVFVEANTRPTQDTRSPHVTPDCLPNTQQFNPCDNPGTLSEGTCGQSVQVFISPQPDISIVTPGASIEAPCSRSHTLIQADVSVESPCVEIDTIITTEENLTPNNIEVVKIAGCDSSCCSQLTSYGGDIPVQLLIIPEVNVPSCSKPVVPNIRAIEAPRVPSFANYPPPPIIIENSKKSRNFKSWLPLLLVALLDGDLGGYNGRNGGGGRNSYCSQNIPTSYPVPLPVPTCESIIINNKRSKSSAKN